MKAIKCELCGSSEIVKQDGYFTCQHCGTKYTAEEAKTLIIKGSVQVTGTVSIDNQEKIRNLHQLAERALQQGDSKNAIKYFDKVLEEDPMSWKAVYYRGYCEVLESSIDDLESAIFCCTDAISAAFRIIKDHIPDEEEQKEAYTQITLSALTLSSFLHNKAMEKQGSPEAKTLVYLLCSRSSILAYSAGYSVEYYFSERTDSLEIIMDAYKQAVEYASDCNVGAENKILAEAMEFLKRHDKTYVAPKISKKDGCYIATSIYGSYNCPQVWVLRRYRDDILLKTILGKAFIKVYYFLSPRLVKYFGSTMIFQRYFKKILDIRVEALLRNGVDDSPYYD